MFELSLKNWILLSKIERKNLRLDSGISGVLMSLPVQIVKQALGGWYVVTRRF